STAGNPRRDRDVSSPRLCDSFSLPFVSLSFRVSRRPENKKRGAAKARRAFARKRDSLRVSLPNGSPAEPFHRDVIVHRARPPFVKNEKPNACRRRAKCAHRRARPVPGKLLKGESAGDRPF